jgi:hypothetical protein
MSTGDELAASCQEAGLDHRTQRPAHQEPPRPRPEPAWPPGQAGGRGRQAPQRRGRPRSRAAPTACGPAAHGAPRQWTRPAPRSAAVAQPVAPASPSLYQGVLSDVAPPHRTVRQHDPERASPRKRPARRHLRQLAPRLPPAMQNFRLGRSAPGRPGVVAVAHRRLTPAPRPRPPRPAGCCRPRRSSSAAGGHHLAALGQRSRVLPRPVILYRRAARASKARRVVPSTDRFSRKFT